MDTLTAFARTAARWRPPNTQLAANAGSSPLQRSLGPARARGKSGAPLRTSGWQRPDRAGTQERPHGPPTPIRRLGGRPFGHRSGRPKAYSLPSSEPTRTTPFATPATIAPGQRSQSQSTARLALLCRRRRECGVFVQSKGFGGYSNCTRRLCRPCRRPRQEMTRHRRSHGTDERISRRRVEDGNEDREIVLMSLERGNRPLHHDEPPSR
jgi:hypothetical protein